MKIIKITDEEIIFDNGCYLTYAHNPDCCEYNYADFSQLEDTCIEDEEFEFSEKMLEFECDYGFRLVAKSGNKYFIPCYSCQNGYYSNTLDIIFKGEKGEYISNIECDIID